MDEDRPSVCLFKTLLQPSVKRLNEGHIGSASEVDDQICLTGGLLKVRQVFCFDDADAKVLQKLGGRGGTRRGGDLVLGILRLEPDQEWS